MRSEQGWRIQIDHLNMSSFPCGVDQNNLQQGELSRQREHRWGEHTGSTRHTAPGPSVGLTCDEAGRGFKGKGGLRGSSTQTIAFFIKVDRGGC